MQLRPALLSVAACAAALFFDSGCGNRNSPASESDDTSSVQKDDWVQKAATPAQQPYLDYGRGVVETVAARAYGDFYAQLSTQARARLSLNQFAPEDEEAAFARHENQPRLQVGLPEFEQLMARTENRFGLPRVPLDLHVHTLDPKALSGAKAQGLDAVDAMFAIGNMPAQIPAAVRKASLRAKIGVELSAAELAKAAKDQGVSVEELQKDPDFLPYLTLKLVLVEDAGQLRVGYFEFLPPSMLD